MTDQARRLVAAAREGCREDFPADGWGVMLIVRLSVAAVLHELAAYCVEVGTDLNDSDFYEWADEIESELPSK